MKYSIYNKGGFYCQTNSYIIAYRTCLEYLMQIDPLNYTNLKEELDRNYYHNIHNFGVMGYIWTVGSDKDERKMGC